MIAGCYTLDLYCDNPDCASLGTGPDQYTAETGAIKSRYAMPLSRSTRRGPRSGSR